MFRRSVTIESVDTYGKPALCPIKWIDSFAMQNFTNDAIFDDTLPVGDGQLEIGNRIPIASLQSAMESWFLRKGYLKPEDRLRVTEMASAS